MRHAAERVVHFCVSASNNRINHGVAQALVLLALISTSTYPSTIPSLHAFTNSMRLQKRVASWQMLSRLTDDYHTQSERIARMTCLVLYSMCMLAKKANEKVATMLLCAFRTDVVVHRRTQTRSQSNQRVRLCMRACDSNAYVCVCESLQSFEHAQKDKIVRITYYGLTRTQKV